MHTLKVISGGILLLGVCLLLERWIRGAAASVVATTIKKSITSQQGRKRPRGWVLGHHQFFDPVEHYRGSEKRFYNYVFVCLTNRLLSVMSKLATAMRNRRCQLTGYLSGCAAKRNDQKPTSLCNRVCFCILRFSPSRS